MVERREQGIGDAPTFAVARDVQRVGLDARRYAAEELKTLGIRDFPRLDLIHHEATAEHVAVIGTLADVGGQRGWRLSGSGGSW
jgi:hypothetical protein